MTSPTIAKTKKKIPSTNVMGRVKTSYPRLRTILVPLDFSGKSRQALRYAVPLAQKFSAQIVLLHVVHSDYNTSAKAGSAPPIPRAVSQPVLRRLEEMAGTLVPAAQRGQNFVQMGSPYVEILATARRLDVDLIVLSTQGRSGVKAFFVGSTAEQIMRHATCPVLSVRRQ